MNLYLQQRRSNFQHGQRGATVLARQTDTFARRLSSDIGQVFDSLSPSFIPQQRVARFVFTPESNFCFAWDLVTVFLLVYQTFELPVIFCFGVVLPLSAAVLDFVITVFFLVDIGEMYAVVTFNRAVYIQGELSSNHKEIACAYMQFW